MSFPEQSYEKIDQYASAYFEQIDRAQKSVSPDEMQAAAKILCECYQRGNTLYVCGNGGSSAISNHLICDHLKGIRNQTEMAPKVVSLVNNMETLTAIANDLSYEEVFAFPLASLAVDGDVLITISSSGDSENVVRALRWAKDNGVKVISMTGFAGGRTAQEADVNLHVAADNYGVVEDVHQSLMHILAQYIRQLQMPDDAIEKNKF